MPAEPAAPVAPIPADPAPTAAPVVTNTVLLGKKPRTLTERITATNEWLKTTPDTHYFIQLLNTDATSQRQVEIFVDNTEKLLDPQQIRVYRSNLSGRDKLGVIYGDFASREAANAALAKLPDPIRTSRPYIRATSKLH
jgi:septal ring-binding cell division protein DamX